MKNLVGRLKVAGAILALAGFARCAMWMNDESKRDLSTFLQWTDSDIALHSGSIDIPNLHRSKYCNPVQAISGKDGNVELLLDRLLVVAYASAKEKQIRDSKTIISSKAISMSPELIQKANNVRRAQYEFVKQYLRENNAYREPTVYGRK